MCHKREDTEEDKVFILDSGSTVNIVGFEQGMFEHKTREDTVTVGTGSQAISKKTGSVVIKGKNGEDIKITDALIIPGFNRNIISLPRLIKKGFKATFDKDGATVQKDKKKIRFEIEKNTGFFILKGKQEMPDETHINEKLDKIDINKAHKIFGHANEATV